MSDSNLDESSDQKPTLSKSTVIYDEIVLDDNSDEESQSALINSNGDSEKVNTASQCNGNNGNIVDTYTLSSDEEGENVDYSVSDIAVKSEDGPDPWKEQISQCIETSIKSKEQETFNEQCKKIEDSFVFLEKEICNIMEQCILLKESSEKYAYPETHIIGEGDIDREDDSLNIQEPVQRIVQIDSIKREISKDVPVETEGSKINLGDIKKAIEDPEIDIVNMTTLADLQKLYKLPNSGPIVRKPLAIGDQVFAVTDPKNMAKSLWQPATIIETCKISGKIHYNVTFEDSFIPCIFLKGTQLAYRQTPSVMLSNRNRVIAHYPTESSPPLGESNRKFLFSGLIAEVARRINLFRYLVFFDNGLVAYVPCDSVFLIAEENMSFLDDIPEERKPFLKKYFNDYPERALVKYQAGARDYVDIDGKWVPGRVKQVDCSLVRFYFRRFEKYEWLYRGSPRLKPLSGLFKALENPETNGKKRHSRKGTSQSSILGYSRKQRPFVQFVRDEDSFADEDDKRYAPRSGTKRLDSFESSVEGDFELYPEFITKPNRYLVSSPHVPHRCSPSCINVSYEDISKYRDTNPYAIPIICGWDRQVACYTNHVKNKKKRTIFYVSPCGRRFRNIEEVDIFLSITKSKLSIDLFTYHPKLVLYSELNGKTSQGCYYYDADVARGTENHSLSCINWVNDEPITPGFKYWPARFAASGVNLELDPHFLVCCDCTDNCRDKSKCECQRLTKDSFEVIRNILNLDDDYGYNYRRLYEAFHTGIWECNTNCACNVNCANRVVQNGIRVRLQIFKTKKKGWGIRCLHDIPPGAFICIYAAEVLNEELADAHGANFGDEYLADLDYIETVENFKEGYEESPYVELSSDESISPLSSDQEFDSYHHKSRGRKKTSKRKGSNKKSRKNTERTKKTKKPGKPIRQLYGEKAAYSLDAKRKGNVGRYFNHSCDPNCFVQNVFIDTHDLRFPWVALFSSKFVPAFTELCWDYNYEIIEGRKMWCHCGASNCRGRLL